jgi:hypothetical protein
MFRQINDDDDDIEGIPEYEELRHLYEIMKLAEIDSTTYESVAVGGFDDTWGKYSGDTYDEFKRKWFYPKTYKEVLFQYHLYILRNKNNH